MSVDVHILEQIDNVAVLIESRYSVLRPIALVGAVVLLSIPDATITSGYRSPAKNEEEGGKPNSFHIHRRALDIVVPKVFVKQAMQIGTDHRCKEVIDEGDHVHFAR